MLQGVLGGACFAGYGLGLFGQLDQGEILLASISIATASVLLVSLWTRLFTRGPLEPLLRLAK